MDPRYRVTKEAESVVEQIRAATGFDGKHAASILILAGWASIGPELGLTGPIRPDGGPNSPNPGPPRPTGGRGGVSLESGKALIQEEEKGKKPSKRARKSHDPAFIEFYETYPRKVGKEDAAKAWAQSIAKGYEPSHIIERTRLFAQSPRGQSPETCWYPATFLRQGHFDNDAWPPITIGQPREDDVAPWVKKRLSQA
jgi:hypothetical protein